MNKVRKNKMIKDTYNIELFVHCDQQVDYSLQIFAPISRSWLIIRLFMNLTKFFPLWFDQWSLEEGEADQYKNGTRTKHFLIAFGVIMSDIDITKKRCSPYVVYTWPTVKGPERWNGKWSFSRFLVSQGFLDGWSTRHNKI